MNYLDIIILILLIIFGFGGWKKGIIIEAASLLGLGLGILAAFYCSDFTAEKLVEWMEINPKYLKVLSFIVTFVVVAVVVNLLGKMIANIVKSLNLGFIDKIGGFVFGVAKGVLLCSLLIMLLNVFKSKDIIKDDDRQSSILFPYVEATIPYVYQGFDLVQEVIKNINNQEESHPEDASDVPPQAI